MINDIIAIAQALQTGGPYVLVAILGWAYWKKDRQLSELYCKLIELTEVHTRATIQMEQAITALRDLLRDKL